MEALENIIFSGIAQKTADVLQLTKSIPIISTSDKYRVFRELAGKENISYPIAYLELGPAQVMTDNTRGNASTMAKQGTYGRILPGTPAYIESLQIIPVNFTLTLVYLDQDFRSTLGFIRRWLLASMDKGLNFNVIYRDITLPIKVVMDTQVTIPQKDNLVNTVNVFDFEAALTVWGYVSDLEAEKVPMVAPVVNTQLSY